MYKNKRIIGIIPARGGSKGIPRKNIKLLKGKPLLYYTLEAVKASKYMDACYVSSEDDEILQVAKNLGAQVKKRPAELSTDTAKSLDAVKHLIKNLEEQYDYIILLQPTSPFRKMDTIDRAISSFIDAGKEYDSLMPLTIMKGKTGIIEDGYYKPKVTGETPRQLIESTFLECGTVFMYKTSNINKENLIGEKIFHFIIDSKIEALELDDMEDWEIVEAIMQAR